jgi:condensin complex subunit 3
LTPEKAFLVRVFVDHCVSTKENARLEKVLPVVTAHAFRIQEAYNSLLDSLAAADEAGGDDEVTDEREFVLAELLRLALNLDYADEIGRRRLEQFVRTCYYPFSSCGCVTDACVARTYDIAGSTSFRTCHTLP